MNRIPFLFIGFLVIIIAPLPAKETGFSGVWQTSYGLMRLVQKGGKVEGCYACDGNATISGTVTDRTLDLTYQEPDGTTGVSAVGCQLS